jgi:outer membrane protein
MAQTFLVKRTNQDVMFNVASQYLQVLLDQELLRIAEENTQVQQVTLDQIKGFVEAGSRAEADQYTQNALLKNQEVIALRARITLENDRATLAQTLQLDPAVPFILVTPDWQTDLGYFENLSLDSLYSIALVNRADLKQQVYLVDGWKRSMRANTSGYYPTLSLFAGYASTYFASDGYKKTGGPPPPSFQDQFVRNNPQTSYGLNLNIPIFDRLQTRTNRISSKVNLQNAELTKENLFKTVKIDVQRSFKNFQTSIDTYQASLLQFQAGELALKVQQESYLLGASNQVALAQANQAYVQGAGSKAQAEVTLLFQKILLEYALGTLKIEDLP